MEAWNSRAAGPRIGVGLAVALALAWQSPRAVAQESTPSPEKLAALGNELEGLMERFHIAGMSAAIVQHRKLLWSSGFGYAHLEEDVRADPDTRYQTASVAKPLGAVLVLQLVEQGKLSLDAPMKDFHVHRWFAPDPARYGEQPVLVRHVLSHTSEGVPGETWSYNGNTYFDLTWVLEDVTRTAFPRLIQERIFDRASMQRSVPGYAAPGTAQVVELAHPYRWNPERGEFEPVKYQMLDPDPDLDVSIFDVVMAMPPEALAARKELLGEGFMHLNGANTAAEVTTTVLDLAKFDIALDEGRLLGAEMRERMWTPTVSNAGKTLPYGLGWFVEEFGGRKVVWHSGLQPPFASALYLKVPAADVSFFLLASNEGLSAPFPMFEQGVRSSAFAHAFLETFGLL